MRTGRRVGLSFACVVLAVILVLLPGLPGILSILLSAGRAQMLLDLLGIFLAYLVSALPGWLLVLPFVIALKDAEAWRSWVILATGIAVGPAFVFVVDLLSLPPGGHINLKLGTRDGIFQSLMISTLTTLCYFAALKIDHKQSTKPEAANLN